MRSINKTVLFLTAIGGMIEWDNRPMMEIILTG